MPGAFKRFFTEKPESKLDYLLVWISISVVPFVVIPIVGVVKGDVGQTMVDNWAMFIVVPMAAAAVLFGAERAQKKR